MEETPEILENVPLAPLTTFQMNGTARYFAKATKPSDTPFLCDKAKELCLPLYILGGGSNTIFADSLINKLVIQIAIESFEILEEDSEKVLIKAGAGNNWDEVVKKSVEMGLFGIEAMSAVPGTVGGAPVQNMGAYGQEIKDILVYVEAYDVLLEGSPQVKVVKLENKDCNFSYRNSIFKQNFGRYIITAVVLELSKKIKGGSNYPSLKKYFEEKGIEPKSSEDIRNAVIKIRKAKLPDPKEIPNAGSFFKNPIVSKESFLELKNKFSDIPSFANNEDYKIPAGWLIDQCGLKGFKKENFGLYEKNALICVHNGKGTMKELQEFVKLIQEKVSEKFGLNLEVEPVFVN